MHASDSAPKFVVEVLNRDDLVGELEVTWVTDRRAGVEHNLDGVELAGFRLARVGRPYITEPESLSLIGVGRIVSVERRCGVHLIEKDTSRTVNAVPAMVGCNVLCDVGHRALALAGIDIAEDLSVRSEELGDAACIVAIGLAGICSGTVQRVDDDVEWNTRVLMYTKPVADHEER